MSLTNPLFTVWVNVSVNSSCDAVNADGFLFEASIVVLEAPNNCTIWIFFAIFSENLCDWLLGLVVGVMWSLSLLVEVLSARSLRLRLSLLLRSWLSCSRSLDVEALSVWRNFWLVEFLRFRCEKSSWRWWWRWMVLLLWIVFILGLLVYRLSFVDEASFCDNWLRSVGSSHLNRSVDSSALLIRSMHRQWNSAGNVETRWSWSIILCERRRQTTKLEIQEEDVEEKTFKENVLGTCNARCSHASVTLFAFAFLRLKVNRLDGVHHAEPLHTALTFNFLSRKKNAMQWLVPRAARRIKSLHSTELFTSNSFRIVPGTIFLLSA